MPDHNEDGHNGARTPGAEGPTSGDSKGAEQSGPEPFGVDRQPALPSNSKEQDDGFGTQVILPGSIAGLHVPEDVDAPVTAMEDASNTLVFTPTESEQMDGGPFDASGDRSSTEVIEPVGGPNAARRDLPQGYQLLSRLSQGSTGTVYKAKQIAMERIVALKIMSGELATDEAYVKRFVREGRASAQLNHPNIVRAFDIGRSGNRYYFASEFVDGGSLGQWLDKQGRLAADKANDIVTQIARGLECAYKSGLMHRDINPGNILLTSDGVAKLSDFGMARRLGASGSASVSGDHSVTSVPDYVSPEQAAGTPADIRSDIYSLGACFYHMVTGRVPFEGKSVPAVLAARIAGPPRAARELEPSVPSRISDIIAKMMATDPQERYPDPTSLLAALQATVPGTPAVAKKIVAPSSKRKAKSLATRAPSVRRSRGTVQTVVAVSIAVLATLAVLAVGSGNGAKPSSSRDPLPPRHIAPSPEPLAKAEPEPVVDLLEVAASEFYKAANGQFNDGDYDGVIAKIDSAKGAYDKTIYRGRIDSLRSGATLKLEEAAEHVAEEQRQREYDSLLEIARSKLRAKEFERAEQALTKAREIDATAEIDELLQVANAGILIEQGEIAEKSGDIPTAIARYQHALRLRADAELEGRIDRLRGMALHKRLVAEGRNAERAEKMREAVAKYDEALKITDDAELREHVAEIREVLDHEQFLSNARSAEQRGELARAIENYEKALVIEHDQALNTHVAGLQRQLSFETALTDADAAFARGAWEESIALYAKALELASEDEKKAVSLKSRQAKLEYDYSSIIAEGEEAAAEGAWERARMRARGALKLKPGHADAIRILKRAFDAVGPEKTITDSIGIRFVLIPQGGFLMGTDSGGDPDERPARELDLPAYYISVCEITNLEYEAFAPLHNSGRSEYSSSGTSPATGISWKEAAAFCQWLSKKEGVTCRLPTEEDWEKAARGTDGRKYPWGNDPPEVSGEPRCNYAPSRSRKAWMKDGHEYAAPVGKFPLGSSPYGCLDMAGNVWEWCMSSSADSGGAEASAVLRGGAFGNDAETLRCTNRGVVRPGFDAPNVGFRCVRELTDWSAMLTEAEAQK